MRKEVTGHKKLELDRKAFKISQKHEYNKHFELGKLYGYPECCIKQFCKEHSLGMVVGLHRNLTYGFDFNIGYVPCDKCTEKLIKIECEKKS